MNMKRIGAALMKGVNALIIPIVVYAIFSILSKGRFFSERMILTTLRQTVVPALICYCLVLNIRVGMVNFSSGAIILISCILGYNLADLTGTGLVGMCVFMILIGILFGVISGFLYIKLRVPCMVLSIGLMLVYEAIPRAIFPNGMAMSYKQTFLAMSPYCFIIMGVMFVIFYLMYNKTAFGHNLQAVGANQAIADNVGINSDKVKFLTFVIGGAFLGVAGILYASQQGELRPVAALGSMSIAMDGFLGMFLALFIAQYCNLAFAAPISALTMRIMSNGFVSLGMSATIRDVTNGVMMLVLLTISANQGLFERRKADKLFAQQANEEYQKR